MGVFDDVEEYVDRKLEIEKDDIQRRVDEEIDKTKDFIGEIEEDIEKALIYGGIALFLGIGSLVILDSFLSLKPAKKSKPINQKPIKKSKPVNSLPDDDQDVVKKLF